MRQAVMWSWGRGLGWGWGWGWGEQQGALGAAGAAAGKVASRAVCPARTHWLPGADPPSCPPRPPSCPTRRFVQCYSCGNPETVIKIRKKSETIELKCKACGHVRCGEWALLHSAVQAGQAKLRPEGAGVSLRLCPARGPWPAPWHCPLMPPPGTACLPACLPTAT